MFRRNRLYLVLIMSMFVFFFGMAGGLYAADIEAVLEDAAGADGLSIQDNTTNEVGRVDSAGNAQFDGALSIDGVADYIIKFNPHAAQ